MPEEKTLLTEAGLSGKEAEVYEILLKLGKVPVNKLLPEISQKRTTVYAVLEELTKKGLVEKDETDPIVKYRAKHPYALKEYLEEQVQEIKTAEDKLDAVFPKFVNLYHQAQTRPGVKFYEGKEGIIKIYEELLKQGENIDSIEDRGEMAEFIPEYSGKYPARRIKREIFNRVIAPESNTINPTSEKQMRETRYIETDKFPFRMDIKIAGKLVSLITFQKENAVGVLVDNHEIADNFKMLFALLWSFLGNNKLEKNTESSTGRA